MKLRISLLALWIFSLSAAVMAASDGEQARKILAEQPAGEMAVGAALAEEVARVKTFSGTVTIARGRQVMPAAPDERLYAGDLLKTGANASLGVTFRDNTLLSLGPNSAVSIRDFQFSPAEGRLSLVTRIVKGTAAYLSGIIAKLSPQSVKCETPVATVGFRGTKFLVSIDEEETP
jgi:hypothetical protein